MCYKLSMGIKLNIFDVSIKEKRAHGSLYFKLLAQQMSKSKKRVHRSLPACKQVQAGRVGDLILNL